MKNDCQLEPDSIELMVYIHILMIDKSTFVDNFIEL